MPTVHVTNLETMNLAAPIATYLVETEDSPLHVVGRIDQVKRWVRENVIGTYIIRKAA